MSHITGECWSYFYPAAYDIMTSVSCQNDIFLLLQKWQLGNSQRVTKTSAVYIMKTGTHSFKLAKRQKVLLKLEKSNNPRPG